MFYTVNLEQDVCRQLSASAQSPILAAQSREANTSREAGIIFTQLMCKKQLMLEKNSMMFLLFCPFWYIYTVR